MGQMTKKRNMRVHKLEAEANHLAMLIDTSKGRRGTTRQNRRVKLINTKLLPKARRNAQRAG